MKSATTSSRPTLKLTFDDKPYAYGSTIEVRVDVTSKGTQILRKGMLELIGKSAFLDKKKTVHVPMVGHGPIYLATQVAQVTYATNRAHPVVDYKKIETQKSVYQAELKLETSRPSHQTFHVSVKVPGYIAPSKDLLEQTWWLVAKLNIAKSRDVIVRKQVHIT